MPLVFSIILNNDKSHIPLKPPCPTVCLEDSMHSYTWQNLANQSRNTLEIYSRFLGTEPYVLYGKSYSHQFMHLLLFLALSSDSSRINSPSSVCRPQHNTHLFTNPDGFVRSLGLLLESDPGFLKESRNIAPILPYIHLCHAASLVHQETTETAETKKFPGFGQ